MIQNSVVFRCMGIPCSNGSGIDALPVERAGARNMGLRAESTSVFRKCCTSDVTRQSILRCTLRTRPATCLPDRNENMFSLAAELHVTHNAMPRGNSWLKFDNSTFQIY